LQWFLPVRGMKILAIQFRYLGDTVLMTPALRAIKEHFPDCELHVLVAKEAAPLLQHLPWLHRVWAFPRKRGKAKLRQSWPMIKALRRERYDRSVDFGGSDRSALMSFLCGARQRLGPLQSGGFLGRNLCYTQTIKKSRLLHESLANLHVLSAWEINQSGSLDAEIRADPAQAVLAARLLPRPVILCHLATSQPKKEWPLIHWVEFHRRATASHHDVMFSTGASPREQSLLEDLKKILPEAPTLPPLPDLGTFLAVLQRAQLFISGDTGPLHFAAGLKVPTIALFGPSSRSQWAPVGGRHRALQGGHCTCGSTTQVCVGASHCMAAISPATVLELLPDASVPSGAAVYRNT
jgi:heptosyltransferase III